MQRKTQTRQHAVPSNMVGETRWLFLLVITVTMSLATADANAQLLNPPTTQVNAVSSQPIRQMLVDEWKQGYANIAKSKTTFESAQSRDELTLLAYAVNRIQFNQTREAKQIVEELTTNYPTNLDGWMLKTWLNALQDNFDASLINMRSFKKQLSQNKDISESSRIMVYKRLGRLIGYMQGPVSSRVNSDILDGTVLRLAEGLKPDVLAKFNESREGVLKAYDNLLQTQAATSQVELEKVRAENEQEKVSLERQNVSLEQTESQLSSQRKQISDDANAQTANLEQQIYSFRQQLNSISSEIQGIQVSLSFLYADLNTLRRQQQDGFNVSTFYVVNQIRSAELALNNLRNSGNAISNQLGIAQRQIAQVQNKARQDLKNLSREQKRVNGSKRRNMARLAKIAGGPELSDGKRSALKNRVDSLQTYDQLSVELYRQEILEHLTVN